MFIVRPEKVKIHIVVGVVYIHAMNNLWFLVQDLQPENNVGRIETRFPEGMCAKDKKLETDNSCLSRVMEEKVFTRKIDLTSAITFRYSSFFPYEHHRGYAIQRDFYLINGISAPMAVLRKNQRRDKKTDMVFGTPYLSSMKELGGDQGDLHPVHHLGLIAVLHHFLEMSPELAHSLDQDAVTWAQASLERLQRHMTQNLDDHDCL